MAEFLCKSYAYFGNLDERVTEHCNLLKGHSGRHNSARGWWPEGEEWGHRYDVPAPKTQFPGGGMRDVVGDRERFDLVWTAAQSYDDQMLVRFARHLAAGAKKYAERNWEEFSGSEAEQHAIGSMLRHVFKLISRQTDEDHAAAVWFNVQAIELIRGKEVKNDEG